MSELAQTPTPASTPSANFVPAGIDRSGERHILGISNIDFKVTLRECSSLFAVEITLFTKGGPARHVHHHQDEWFYIVEGEFLIEVGSDRFKLGPGDSLFAPREVPHVWANAGAGRGRFIGLLAPAGQAEAFFDEAARDKAMPMSPALFHKYGMDLVGPPLTVS